MVEDWSFWLIHLTPLLLKGHFQHLKYYKHFMKFNMILKQTLQYSFPEQELVDFKNNMFKSMKSMFNRILSYIDVHQKQDLLPVQVQLSVCMPTNCTCAL